MFKYLKLADYLRQIITTKCQLKDLIYQSQQQPKSKNKGKDSSSSSRLRVDPRVAYSNLSLILNNINKFEEMYKTMTILLNKKNKRSRNSKSKQRKSNKNSNEHDNQYIKINNKYLLFVLVAQYINVGKIQGGGKLKKFIMDHISLIPQIQCNSKINRNIVNIRLRQACKNKEQLKKWQQILSKYQHNQIVPNLYDLPQHKYSQLTHIHPEIRSSSSCIIQSFSSNLPPYILFKSLPQSLNNKQNVKFDIIDACSAPGNKTIQLAEYLGARGTVWAFQRDERRYNMLNKNITKYQVQNVKTVCADFLMSQPKYLQKVRLIMLDPSCSGSGMLINFSRQISTNNNSQSQDNSTDFQQYSKNIYNSLPQQQKSRISQLKQLQLSLLLQATKFNPLRISYSTCSIYTQQNQQVVAQFLQKCGDSYEVKSVWNKIQNQTNNAIVHGFGNKVMRKCMRVDPRARISDGFFVCIFSKKKKKNKELQ